MDQRRVRPGNGLGVDVAPEVIFVPQQLQCFNHQFSGVVGTDEHRAGQKQTLDVVAPVELDGQLRQLPGGEGGPGQVVGAAVHAVGAVVGAYVGEQHL